MRSAVASEKLQNVYAALARRYDIQHRLLTFASDARGRRLVVAKTVQAGDTVLDAGAGTGATGIAAAREAGPPGHVTLFDFSDDMLDVARRKAQALKLEERFTFATGDMLALPFADAHFDVVLSTYSICPLFDPEKGAMELYRVLKPGGLLGVAHSVSPEGAIMHQLAERLEDVIWRFPGISMGCRAVSVLPALQRAGADLVFMRRLGVPLYPFLVFVVRKPGLSCAGSS